MAGSQGLTASPLNPPGSFNWQYLLAFITNGILTIFFLFYFNRFFAAVVAYLIRLYTWHKFHVYIDIEALQISFLGGRLFFKGIRYHGDNETILVHGGYITWHYWLRKVRTCRAFSNPVSKDEGSGQDREETGPNTKQKEYPCRITVKVSGVEAFLYNRSPAYDLIVNNVAERDPTNEQAQSQSRSTKDAERTSSRPAFEHDGLEANPPELRKPSENEDAWTSEGSTDEDWASDASDEMGGRPYHPPAFLRMLPIHVECNKGAAVLGNEHTQSIITAKFDSAAGTFDASESGPLDIFKILMKFDVTRPFIQMKPNVDFKRPQLAEAATLKGDQDDDDADKTSLGESVAYARKRRNLSKHHRLQNWSKLIPLSRKARQSVDSIARYTRLDLTGSGLDPEIAARQNRWLGLSRYLEDAQQDEHDEWDSIEYAKTSTIADIKSLTFGFFWDIPGKVPEPHVSEKIKQYSKQGDINGNPPPEYGMEIHVRGGHVNYGPWADRHRINLQQIYFPFSYVNSAPSAPLKPGDDRLFTLFKLYLTIDDDTVLRIPFREPSKDWRWKGRGGSMKPGKKSENNESSKDKSKRRSARHRKRDKGLPNTDIRPFAWFDVRVNAGSSISYNMDMYPGFSGYKNALKVDVSGIDIYTSLNHALLWRCGRVKMNCDLSYPLAWAGLHDWLFDIRIKDLDLFLLRDHTFLLVDMIEDWSTGPLPDFMTFVPYRYRLKVNFENFKLFLNVNDANIVNNSDDINDNDFVILYGGRLGAELMIPLDRFRPVQSEITFDVAAFDLGFELRLPARNTLNSFLKDKNVAQLDSVMLQGSYNYYSEVRPGLTETLNMMIHGKSLNIQFYGFLARQLAKIKENYFGDDMHFRTLEEYQDLARRNFEGAQSNQSSTKSNDLDVILDIIADDINILLPAGIYECKEYVKARLETANCDLRVSNYYLELMVNSSPLELSYRSSQYVSGDFKYHDSDTQIFLDSVKFFGHRLFGLPPSEPAYVSNWDIEAGEILGECCETFLKTLLNAVQSLALSITDKENALPLPQLIILNDSTFVRFSCPLIKLWFHVNQEAFMLATQNVKGNFNDLAGQWFSRVLNMNIAKVSVACVEAESLRRHAVENFEVAKTLAYVDTSATFNMLERSQDFAKMKAAQKDFIAAHDQFAPRANFMYAGWRSSNALSQPKTAVSIPLPSLPEPLGINSNTGQPFINQQPQPYMQDFQALNVSNVVEVAGINQTSQSSEQRYGPRGTLNSSKSAFGRPHFLSESEYQSYSPGSFTSCFKIPHFPLMTLRPDLTNVPSISEDLENERPVRSADGAGFNDLLNEDSTHTSFMVDIKPGIVGFVKPKAVHAIANLLEVLQPKTPANILDQFHIDTITSLMAKKAQSRGKNSVTDIGLRIPCIHIRSHNDYTSLEGLSESDEYNFLANQIALYVRIKNVPERKHQENSSSVHMTAKSISVTAQRRIGGSLEGEVALQAQIDDTLLWLLSSDRASIHVSYGAAGISMASRKFDYLASLVHRTTMMVDQFRGRFLQLFAEANRRLRFLVYRLTQETEGRSDAIFFTRPSYFLRTTKDHLRNSNSWMILSKLRHTWFELDDDVKRNQITKECVNGSCELPENAEAYILATIDQWRSWDSMQVQTSEAMKGVFGSTMGPENSMIERGPPITVKLRGEGLKLLIDPGPKQSGVIIGGLIMSLAITPPPPPSAMNLFQEYNEVKSTVVQINTSSVSLHFVWDICHLVDQILTLFEQNTPGQLQIQGPEHANAVQVARSKETFQVVFVSRQASIHLESVHLFLIATTDDLKTSISGSGWADAFPDFSVNALMSARACSLEMGTRDKLIWKSSIVHPSLWVAYDSVSKKDTLEDALKVAGDCDQLHLTIEDEILGIINTANSVVGDEVAYIADLAKKHEGLQQNIDKSSHQKTKRSLRLRLALFLNIYHVKIAVMDGLVYATDGRVIRLAISPEALSTHTYQVNFDLKAQVHTFQPQNKFATRSGPKLSLPPINGRIRAQLAKEFVTVSASVIMEKIMIDGSTLYQILSMVATPQFPKTVDAIKQDANVVLENAGDLKWQNSVPSPKILPPTDLPRPVIFDGHAVLDGLEIKAEAPPTLTMERRTILLFVLGNTQIRVANRAPKGNYPLKFPELHVALGQLSVKIEQTRGDQTRVYGAARFSALFTCAVDPVNANTTKRTFRLAARGPEIRLYPTTGLAIVQILAHMQKRFTGLDLSREKKYLRRLRKSETTIRFHAMKRHKSGGDQTQPKVTPHRFMTSFSFDLEEAGVVYVVKNPAHNNSKTHCENLAFTLKAINLLTRNEKEARLKIQDIRLELRPNLNSNEFEMINHAVLPEVVFDVIHQISKKNTSLAFHANGQALEVVLDPRFMLPISRLERSLSEASGQVRTAMNELRLGLSTPNAPKMDFLGKIEVSSLFVHAAFAGAIVRLRSMETKATSYSPTMTGPSPETSAALKAPGIGLKLQYRKPEATNPTLNVEVRVDGSNNTLHPSVVPLILQVADSLKEIARDIKGRESPKSPRGAITPHESPTQTFMNQDQFIQTDPRKILGKTKLNIGFQICKQEFSLSCQPIAKITALMKLDDIYVTINNVDSTDHGNFFAASISINGLHATLQHVYSRDATLSFKIESIVLSLMNSKHFSGGNGISAMLRINPTVAQVNAKQLQEILLFREIWYPSELRGSDLATTTASESRDPQEYFIRRYQQISTATSFPWHVAVVIADLKVNLDLGQAIGRLSFGISNLWMSSQKTNESQQSLCVGVDEVSVDSTGRMSGYVHLDQVKVRMSIAWLAAAENSSQTPLVQASIGFDRIQIKAAFDYQTFAVADVTSFEFIMYNVRDQSSNKNDRLVAILDGDKVHVYCTALSAALGLSLSQSFERLIQEKQASFEQALKEVDKFMQRRRPTSQIREKDPTTVSDALKRDESKRMPLSLHTDVVVTLGSLDVGAFPRTLLDTQILRLEASSAQARFAVTLEGGTIHSGLSLTLGQVSAALATVPQATVPKTLGDIGIDQVVKNAVSSRGGIILRVPRVVAAMQTWQPHDSKIIDYIFRSSFEGKIDVGWNFSRISFIRGMWETHSRTLASRLGRPLPEPALKITAPDAPAAASMKAAMQSEADEFGSMAKNPETLGPDQKITAVVNLPQSKYDYRALEPPIIETPQLRDMGEATPPLEWIGLQRERLPNITHQIIIVSLLEVVKEVEDAYSRILGSA